MVCLFVFNILFIRYVFVSFYLTLFLFLYICVSNSLNLSGMRLPKRLCDFCYFDKIQTELIALAEQDLDPECELRESAQILSSRAEATLREVVSLSSNTTTSHIIQLPTTTAKEAQALRVVNKQMLGRNIPGEYPSTPIVVPLGKVSQIFFFNTKQDAYTNTSLYSVYLFF